MNITTEFLTTIGELSSLILDLSRTEESLERSIEEFGEQMAQTQIKRAEIESTMIDLISKHGTAHLLETIPYFSQQPNEEPIPSETSLPPLHRLPDDGRTYLATPDAAFHLGVRMARFRRLYREGAIQVYSRSMTRTKPYYFAIADLESLASKGTYCTLTDLESLAKARIDP